MERARRSLIAAVAQNGVIGTGDRMPWRLSSDMKRFKSITMGKPVIMGRKTYDTIGKPLAGRLNIVVSRNIGFAPDGVVVTPNFEAALVEAERGVDGSSDREIMVIGGGEIYRAAIDCADRLYITHVEDAPEGDIRFPPIDPALWRATAEEPLPVGPKDSAATIFVIYERAASKSSG